MDDEWTLNVGDPVTIVDGPFGDFDGIVESIREEADKARAKISFFGRDTPIELPISQIGEPGIIE